MQYGKTTNIKLNIFSELLNFYENEQNASHRSHFRKKVLDKTGKWLYNDPIGRVNAMFRFVNGQMNTAANTGADAPAYSSCGQICRIIMDVAFAASFLFVVSAVRLSLIAAIPAFIIIFILLIGKNTNEVRRTGVNG